MGNAISRQVGLVYMRKVIEQASRQSSSTMRASSTCLDSLDDGPQPVSQTNFFHSRVSLGHGVYHSNGSLPVTPVKMILRICIDRVPWKTRSLSLQLPLRVCSTSALCCPSLALQKETGDPVFASICLPWGL